VHASLLQMIQPAVQAAVSSSATSSPSSTPAPSPTDPGVDLTNTFLQLLSVQLQNQSPLDPVDPNQFTVELAQFDSLGELTQIQELMQTLVNDVTPTSSSTDSAGTAAASANSTATQNLNPISHY
jgi:flagellar basal-body rod modification protein FlgD